MHLIAKELLVGKHSCFLSLVLLAKLFAFFLAAFDPAIHVGLVGPRIVLLPHTLLTHLVRQYLVQLLMLQALLSLFVDVLEASLFVLFEALLDVLLLLFQL